MTYKAYMLRMGSFTYYRGNSQINRNGRKAIARHSLVFVSIRDRSRGFANIRNTFVKDSLAFLLTFPQNTGGMQPMSETLTEKQLIGQRQANRRQRELSEMCICN